MKEYNKEKLHEYAKELFALCLEKNIHFKCSGYIISIYLENEYTCYLNKAYYNASRTYVLPIWELIEKVKQL